MKFKKLSKLTLNKKTIANLDRGSLSSVKGGAPPPQPSIYYGDCVTDAEFCETLDGWNTCGACTGSQVFNCTAYSCNISCLSVNDYTCQC